jgi:hypothetical protein
MALTKYIEMFPGECWQDVANGFMTYCHHERNVLNGGCHEGDPVSIEGGERYATISIPDQHAELIDIFYEWAARERRKIR